jgi:hypothetical protein
MAGSPPQAPRNERYFADIYRYVPALADMPDVRSLGSTTDTLGTHRRWYQDRRPKGCVRDRRRPGRAAGRKVSRTLIIDPKRSYVLEDQTRVGDRAALNIDTLILDVGWTSTSLHEPALPGGTAGAAGTSSA